MMYDSMKLLTLVAAAVLITSCKTQSHQETVKITEEPCKQSVTTEIYKGETPAVIVKRSNEPIVTTEVSCPDDMREVSPSKREIEVATRNGSWEKDWFDKHITCIPDSIPEKGKFVFKGD